MNFLGHIYFSNNDLELMQANLFGDFVKGNKLEHFPQKIQDGILLHRRIDGFIDHHPSVVKLLHQLYESLPKVAGIAVDLYFDHLLAKNWKEFHQMEYKEFIQKFYDSLNNSTEFYSEKFQSMLAKMKSVNWLYYYQFMEGLEKSSTGLSKRISFPNQLHLAPQVFMIHEKKITETFFEYMEDAKKEFF